MLPLSKLLSIFLIDTDNQRVIIKVKDVNDEPPYFINRPLPMQAVVKLNAPPNTRVFTLQAKDPDTDHNIHYFLVRDRTGGRFEVDERSGTNGFEYDISLNEMRRKLVKKRMDLVAKHCTVKTNKK